MQGTRGEIDDLTIRYLNEQNVPVTQTLNRIDLGFTEIRNGLTMG